MDLDENESTTISLQEFVVYHPQGPAGSGFDGADLVRFLAFKRHCTSSLSFSAVLGETTILESSAPSISANPAREVQDTEGNMHALCAHASRGA